MMKIIPAFSCILATLLCFATSSQAEQSPTKTIPVILDTDIGNDIDDMWALALLLKCPELDVKLIVTDMDLGIYRAKLIAKFLEVAGRTDIPVAIGHGGREGSSRQQEWVEDYDLDSYPGTLHQDGAQATIDTIMNSKEMVTVLAIGPVPNLAEALRREPRIAEKARFVGMHGAVRKGYGGSDKIVPEYNVKADAPACQAVFTASWDITITPLDTCGILVLKGDRFARVRDSDDPLNKALIENYYLWAENTKWFEERKEKKTVQSSTLFDAVAVYLAISNEFCKMETLPIRVTDVGMTVIDPKAKEMEVATEWNDLEAFEDWMVDRLTAKPAAH